MTYDLQRVTMRIAEPAKTPTLKFESKIGVNYHVEAAILVKFQAKI